MLFFKKAYGYFWSMANLFSILYSLTERTLSIEDRLYLLESVVYAKKNTKQYMN